MKKILKAAVVVVIVLFAAAAMIGVMFGTKTQEDLDRERAEATQRAESDEANSQAVDGETTAEPVADKPAQVFESDFATVEYVDTQDAAGNAVVTFSLTNTTGRAVMVTGENVVVNGQYAVQALGGSTVPIGPGETGAVSLSFGVQVQTPLSGTSDMETLSCDLVLLDNDSLTTELGRVPVSVTL